MSFIDRYARKKEKGSLRIVMGQPSSDGGVFILLALAISEFLVSDSGGARLLAVGDEGFSGPQSICSS